MFANLKNKLIEEVKASPSKFQQLAQQAQAAVSSSATPSSGSGSDSAATSTTTTNENFFSITEEDTPQNTPLRLPFTGHRGRTITPQTANGSTGAIPRTRKLSNSSMASDVSFRLPSYDAAPATYHLQSDMESEYGSEFGDDVTSPAKLEVISKEKLFEAYKRSLERYNKYRCRYTDLVKQYKELERDSSKARAVLIETQDKALRRINELREQCSLEQGAKAHLEQALRVEMDDMKCKIHAYETKLKLLGENPENIKIQSDNLLSDSLIDLDNAEQSAGALNGNANNISEAQNEDAQPLTNKINELELELKKRDVKIEELCNNLAKSQQEIEKLKKQEEENSLLLAQTKQAIHTELESKENEVKKLKNELKQLASKKDDERSSELKDLREKLKQALASKQEVDAKLIASEHLYSELKEQQATNDKSKSETADKLREHEQKILDLRQQNTQLSEMLQRYQQNEVSLAEIDNELNRTKNENDNLRSTLEESTQKLNATFNELRTYKEECERHKAKLEEQSSQQTELQQQITQLMTELTQLRTESAKEEQEILAELRAAVTQAKETHAAELESLKEQLNGRDKELKTSGNKMAKQKKQHETQQNKIKEQNAELEKLRQELNQHAEHLQMLQTETTAREQQTETEKTELKSQITNILQEIRNMEEQLHEVQRSHADLEQEKLQLESHIKTLQEENEKTDTNRQADLEKKLQNIEVENSQLAERNCLLTENVNRLEKQLAEKERQHTSEAAHESELRAKLETAEDGLQRLNEKMAQVLDENSRMQNAQELMDHDHRTLQDKCDALEKEKLIAEDEMRRLQSEIQRLSALQLETQAEQAAESHAKTESLRQQIATLNAQLTALGQVHETNQQLRIQLEQQNVRIAELMELDNNYVESIKEKEKEIEMLKAQTDELEIQMLSYERAKEELLLVLEQKENLTQQLTEQATELEDKALRIQELEKQNVSSENLNETLEQQNKLIAEKTSELEKMRDQMSKNTRERIEEHESLKQELTELIELEHRAVEQLEESKAEQLRKIEELELRLQAANVDIERLHENNVAYQVEIEQLQTKQQLEVQELTATLRRLQDEHTKLQSHIEATNEQANRITDNEQLKIENEYLTKHVKQLEHELETKKSDTSEQNKVLDELKEKLKSLQCELYVLKENAEAHQNEQRVKENELADLKEAETKLKLEIENQKLELKRQTEHADYVTQQNDGIQKDLLHVQQQLQEKTLKLETTEASMAAKQLEMETLQNELTQKSEASAALAAALENSKAELQALEVAQTEKVQAVEAAALNTTMPSNAEHLRELNAKLQLELEELKHNSTTEITHLQHEIDDLKNSVKHGNERILELETMRAGLQAQQLFSTDMGQGGVLAPEMRHEIDQDDVLRQNAELEMKLREIMNEVQEVSNRNIFLEQQCENYLILEQSNERLKSQNAKLSRQLDETLVSVQHNDGMNPNTEFEYLRNIMFQYFTSTSNGNNETLVKVISAVLKFSPQQTQVALEKEHQRRSLLNKIL